MKQEKRVIESVGELVEVLSQGVGVETNHPSRGFNWHKVSGNIWDWVKKFGSWQFRYSEPVEVVELWGWKGEEDIIFKKGKWFSYHTHKQTQIIQDGKVIYTKTEEI